eukprot:5370825-Pleurochrysis_carterae.AAC.1
MRIYDEIKRRKQHSYRNNAFVAFASARAVFKLFWIPLEPLGRFRNEHTCHDARKRYGSDLSFLRDESYGTKQDSGDKGSIIQDICSVSAACRRGVCPSVPPPSAYMLVRRE